MNRARLMDLIALIALFLAGWLSGFLAAVAVL